MNDFNLIMVAAGFEHGGNVTHRHFDSHPQCFTYPTESMLGTPTSSNLLTPAIPFRYAWPSFDSEMTLLEAYHAFYDEEVKTFLRTPFRSKFKDCGMVIDEEERIRLFANECECLRQLDHDGNDQWINSRREYIKAYFRSTFLAWTNFARTGKESHYVGYLPAIHLDASKLFADFPTAKMVYVSRNPFSAYADTIKRPFPWSLERYCQIHNVLQNHARICERKWPKQFFTVRYEDLIADPTSVLNELCGPLGLESFTEMPRPSFNRKPLVSVRPWGTIVSPTTEANIATAKGLSHEQSRQILQECNQTIKDWGYLSFYDSYLW